MGSIIRDVKGDTRHLDYSSYYAWGSNRHSTPFEQAGVLIAVLQW